MDIYGIPDPDPHNNICGSATLAKITEHIPKIASKNSIGHIVKIVVQWLGDATPPPFPPWNSSEYQKWAMMRGVLDERRSMGL